MLFMLMKVCKELQCHVKSFNKFVALRLFFCHAVEQLGSSVLHFIENVTNSICNGNL